MCSNSREDLINFILWCPAYLEKRQKCTRLQQSYIENEQKIIGQFLLKNENIKETKDIIKTFWNIREKKRKDNNNT